MHKIITTGFGILFLLLAGAPARAELQFIDNFDAMSTGNLGYNIPTVGGGGVLSTNTGGASGNIYVESNSGSNVVRFMTTTDGTGSRGFGVAALDNPIESAERGVLFFRFSIRAEGNAADTYFGIHALSGVTPFSVAGNDPEDHLVAGFHVVNGTGSAVNLVKTRDAASVLLADLVRGQWYNCWIDADYASKTFDLYVSAAEGPAGEATLPTLADKIADALPFENADTYGSNPLTGAFFATPRISSTTRSSNQSARTYIDEIYWDGDAGLVFTTKGARNPVPAAGTEQADLTQVLSWDAPDDPNVAQVLGYDVYLGMDETDVLNGEPSALVSAGQTTMTYDPVPDLSHDTTYFWRVETTVRLNDPNQTVTVDAGKVWHFSTLSSFPVITQQPADTIVEQMQTAVFTTAADSVSQISYQWYKSGDRANDTPDDDAIVAGAFSATLTLSSVTTDDEGYYYCRLSNPSVTNSEAAALAVQRELAHWTMDQSHYDQANELYLDSASDYHAAINTPGSVPAFDQGAAIPTADGAVLFDPNTAGVASLLNPSEYSNQLTLSAWVKWDGTPLGEFGNIILQKGPDYATAMWTWKVRQNDTNFAGSRFYNNFGLSAQTGNLIEANAWTHVCATWDGSAARVYINGELAATDTSGALGTDSLGDLQITGSDNFPGVLDEVRVFNAAFDLTAIASELYSPVSGKSVCVDPDDPVLATYDVNDDCIVDLSDFAMMASHWMDCFAVPDCIERP